MTEETDLAGMADRLRGLLEKATRGPWKHYDEVFRPKLSARRVTEIQRRDGKPVVSWGGFDGLPSVTARKANANAALIVAAVNALPALLDHIASEPTRIDEARREAVEPLLAALKSARGWLVTCSESAHARKDLAQLDAAIHAATEPTRIQDRERVLREHRFGSPPEPVANPSEAWCDAYSDWYYQRRG